MTPMEMVWKITEQSTENGWINSTIQFMEMILMTFTILTMENCQVMKDGAKIQHQELKPNLFFNSKIKNSSGP